MKSFKKTYMINEDASSVNGFVILKPEFLNHEEDFLKLLDNNGWKVIQKMKKKLSQAEAEELYKMHKEKDFYKDLCKYMCSDDCLCCLCHKDCKDPIKDMDALKDKVRKTWGKDEMKNGMHSSDSLENVNRESKLIFEKKIVEYDELGNYVGLADFCDEPCGEPACVGCEAPANPDPGPMSILQTRIIELKLSYTEEEGLELVNKLQNALAEELNAWYAYTIIIPFLEGQHKEETIDFFKETAKDELEDHAYWLMERLNQLGVYPQPIIGSTCWDAVAKHKYIAPVQNILGAIRNNIAAECGAIETYQELERFTRDRDVVSNTKIKEILADEQQHLADLYDLEKDFIG